jgi:exodeoxyribonuclease X
MTVFRIVDLETTGKEPSDEIIEIGFCDLVVYDDGEVFIKAPRSALFMHTRGNPAEARAVHHITDAMLEGRPVCDVNHIRDTLMLDGQRPDILVAHQAQFEQQYLTPDICRDLPWICTWKTAKHTHPTLSSHSNGAIRYHFQDNDFFDDLGDLAMPPHRAAPDCYVTAHNLSALLQFATVEQMLTWTTQPAPMHVINFGKHKGWKLGEVPFDYLKWIAFTSDLDADTKWNARAEMDRRGARAH